MEEYIVFIAILSILINIYFLLFRNVLVKSIERLPSGCWAIVYSVCRVNGNTLTIREFGKRLIPTLFNGWLRSRCFAKIITDLKRRGKIKLCQTDSPILDFGNSIDRTQL